MTPKERDINRNDLNREEISRYSRHILLPEVGMAGQKKLKAARVLIIGAGGLGSPVSLYLAAAGVGEIGLVDFDRVDLSNLQRQIIFREADRDQSKAQIAGRELERLNPHIKINVYETRLDASNIAEIFTNYDLVVDGTDNFPTRYLVNDACVMFKKPLVYGSIFRFDGQASVFAADKPNAPCYRCVFPEPPPPGQVPNCAEGGVLGILPGLIGLIQSTEAIKWILKLGDSLVGRLLIVDALAMSFDHYKIHRNKDCPVCGDHPSITTIKESASSCEIAPAGRSDDTHAINPATLAAWRKSKPHLLLVDVRSETEAAICKIDGSLLAPLSEIESGRVSLPPGSPVVFYCKSGKRSATARSLVASSGRDDLFNLDGGILAWIDDIDSTLMRY